MCGIVGYYGDTNLKAKEACIDMLFMDVVRGKDSTGVALLNYKGELKINKHVGLPDMLFAETDFGKDQNMLQRMFLGHNRAATAGEVTNDNAHPFQSGNIVGVHNGTLRGKHRLKDWNKFGTDSEALIHTIAEEGIEEAWKLVEGAATVVFYDEVAETFSFIRNSERPFVFATSEDGKGLFFSSEGGILRAAAGRRGLKLTNFLSPKPNHLFEYHYDGKEMFHEVRELAPFRHSYHGGHHYRQHQGNGFVRNQANNGNATGKNTAAPKDADKRPKYGSKAEKQAAKRKRREERRLEKQAKKESKQEVLKQAQQNERERQARKESNIPVVNRPSSSPLKEQIKQEEMHALMEEKKPKAQTLILPPSGTNPKGDDGPNYDSDSPPSVLSRLAEDGSTVMAANFNPTCAFCSCSIEFEANTTHIYTDRLSGCKECHEVKLDLNIPADAAIH